MHGSLQTRRTAPNAIKWKCIRANFAANCTTSECYVRNFSLKCWLRLGSIENALNRIASSALQFDSISWRGVQCAENARAMGILYFVNTEQAILFTFGHSTHSVCCEWHERQAGCVVCAWMDFNQFPSGNFSSLTLRCLCIPHEFVRLRVVSAKKYCNTCNIHLFHFVLWTIKTIIPTLNSFSYFLNSFPYIFFLFHFRERCVWLMWYSHSPPVYIPTSGNKTEFISKFFSHSSIWACINTSYPCLIANEFSTVVKYEREKNGIAHAANVWRAKTKEPHQPELYKVW